MGQQLLAAGNNTHPIYARITRPLNAQHRTTPPNTAQHRTAPRRSHDWSSCSWAHPKEQARRRDPRRYHYLPVMCPHAKQGAFACPRGDACDMAHQVYEYVSNSHTT